MLLIGRVKPHHAHYFFVKTTFSKDHYHIINGFTRMVNGNEIDRHDHLFRGITSFDHNHYHRFYGKTGLAIPLPEGGHYHLLEMRTYFNYDRQLVNKYGGVVYGDSDHPKHDHLFKGKTGRSVGEDL